MTTKVRQQRIGDFMQQMAAELGVPLQTFMDMTWLQVLALREEQQKRRVA